jgi:hypothetical protein
LAAAIVTAQQAVLADDLTLQQLMNIINWVFPPWEAANAIWVLKWLARHFAWPSYDRSIRQLLHTRCIRGWTERVVVLLSERLGREAAAAFSIIFSQVFLAVMNIGPVRDVLGAAACTRLCNCWSISSVLALARLATAQAVVAGIVGAGRAMALQQQQQQQGGAPAAADGTVMLQRYQQHLQDVMEAAEASENMRPVKQVRMQAVAPQSSSVLIWSTHACQPVC